MLLLISAGIVTLPELRPEQLDEVRRRLVDEATSWLRTGVRMTMAERALLTPLEVAALAEAADRISAMEAARIGIAAQGLRAAAEVMSAVDGGRTAASMDASATAAAERMEVDRAADRVANGAMARGPTS